MQDSDSGRSGNILLPVLLLLGLRLGVLARAAGSRALSSRCGGAGGDIDLRPRGLGRLRRLAAAAGGGFLRGGLR